LQDAITRDTAAWRDAQTAAADHVNALDAATGSYSDAAAELEKFSAFRTLSAERGIEAAKDERDSAEELEKAQNRVAGSLQGVGSSSKDAAEGISEITSSSASARPPVNSLAEAQDRLKESTNEATEAYDENTAALGLAAYEWGAAVVNAALLETASYDSADALKEMGDAGVDLGKALALEMQEAGAGAEYLDQKALELFGSMSVLEKLWNGLASGLETVTFGFIDMRTQTGMVVDDIWDLESAVGSVSASAETAVESQNLLLQTTVELADGTSVAASELAEMDATALIMKDTISGLGLSVDELREGFASFVDPLAIWRDTQEDARQKLDDTNASLLNIEGGFSLYLDKLQEASAAQMNWASNLLRLGSNGDIPPEVLAGLAQMGPAGAAIVQGLVNASDEEVQRYVSLWQQGGGAVLDSFSIVFAECMVQAAQAGDQGGLDFVTKLHAQVGEGEISMAEAVDQMTEYAETEFANADPTLEFYGDATEALNEMNDLLEEVRDIMKEANEEAEIEPDLDTGGWWDSLSSWYYGTLDWLSSLRNQFRAVMNMLSGRNAFSGIGGSGTARFADGGWVSGPGGSRQDKIPAMLSDNEFVVNARSAKEFGPLLEWINGQRSSGSTPIMAPKFVPDDILTVPRRPLDH